MRSGLFRFLIHPGTGSPAAGADQLPDVILIGGHAVRLVERPRSKRISLKIDPVRREAVVSVPSLREREHAVRFARQNADWISRHLAALPPVHAPYPGGRIAVFGDDLSLTARPGRSGRILGSDGQLVGLGAADDAAFGDRIIGLIRKEARNYFTDRTAYYTDLLKQDMPSVTIVDARSRWGSCKPAWQGRPASIRYSWRLALAPEPVADYVAAHECAHLIEANHGPGFWAIVRQLAGDPAPHRRWLRAEGSRLKAFAPTVSAQGPG